jgi:hypothetical protein
MKSTKNKQIVKCELNARQKQFFQAHDLGTLLLRPVERLVHPYAWLGHLPFTQVLIRLMRPKVFVELGTHTGNSFCAFCQAVAREGLDTRCSAIDTWEGDAHAGYYADSVFEELESYIRATYVGWAKLLRMTFDEALNQFEDGTVDLLHIDGLHTYEAVLHDYDKWRSKLSAQGVVLFHDTQVFDRGFGVHRLWSEMRAKYHGFEFQHSHGLGILLVGEEVASAVREFIDMATDDPDPIQVLFEHASLLSLPNEAITYQRRFGKATPPDVVSLDCELFLDHGKGFSESSKLISSLRLEQGTGVVHYELGRFTDGLLRVRFDPGSQAIFLKELTARWRGVDGEWQPLSINRSSAIAPDRSFLLFAADPWLEFVTPSDRVTSIEIELQVKEIVTELINLLIDETKLIAKLEEKDLSLDKSAKLIAELQEKLGENEVVARKLWADLAEKDRHLTILHNIVNLPLYRFLARLKLLPFHDFNSRG